MASLNKDYTIYLYNGQAFSDSAHAVDITSEVEAAGLSYSANVWTMDDFNFTTSAAIGIQIDTAATITVNGISSITGGDSSASTAYGIYSVNKSLTLNGSGSLSVTAGSGNASYGISAGNADISISGGSTITATANNKNGEAATYGVYTSSGTVSVSGGSTVNATAIGHTVTKSTSGVSVGIYADRLTIGDNNSKIVASAEEGSSNNGAVIINDPNVTAQNSSGNRLTYSSKNYTDGSKTASDVTLSGNLYDFTLYLTAGTAYKDGVDDKKKITIKDVFGSDDVLKWNADTQEWEMNNFTFNTTKYRAIVVSTDDLTIKVIGNNAISSANASTGMAYGMLANFVNLTLKGTGSLNVNAGYAAANYCYSYGLASTNNSGAAKGCITIDEVTLKVYGNSGNAGTYGINSANTLTITNGAEVTANASSKNGTATTAIYSAGTISVSGGSTVTVSASNTSTSNSGTTTGISSAGTISVSGGSTVTVSESTAVPANAYGVTAAYLSVSENSSVSVTATTKSEVRNAYGLDISNNVYVSNDASKIYAEAKIDTAVEASKISGQKVAVHSEYELSSKVTSDEAGQTALVYDSTNKYYKNGDVPAAKAYISYAALPPQISVTYGLYLSSGQVYANSTRGQNLTDAYSNVLYWNGSEWVMNNLDFTTTAATALTFADSSAATVKVYGTNTITGSTSGTADYFIKATSGLTLNGLSTADSLTVSAQTCTYGIFYTNANNLAVKDLTFKVTNEVTSTAVSRGFRCAGIAFDNTEATITVKNNGTGMAQGHYSDGNADTAVFSVSNNSKINISVQTQSNELVVLTNASKYTKVTVDNSDLTVTGKCLGTSKVIGLYINSLTVKGQSLVTSEAITNGTGTNHNAVAVTSAPTDGGTPATTLTATDKNSNTLTHSSTGYLDAAGKQYAEYVKIKTGNPDYTLVLFGDKAYRNSYAAGNEIDLTAEFGTTLTVSSVGTVATWTMSNFNFTTSASTAIQVMGSAVISVTGTNTVTNGTAAAAATGVYYTVQSINGNLQIKSTDSGTLALNNTGATTGVSYGLYAEKTIGIDGATVTANVTSSSSSTPSAGVKADSLVITNSARVTATADDTNSYGLDVKAAIVGDADSVVHATGEAAYHGSDTAPNVYAYADSGKETSLTYDTTAQVFKNSGVVATEAYVYSKDATSFYFNSSYTGTPGTLTADNHVIGYDAFSDFSTARTQAELTGGKLYITGGGAKLSTTGFNCVETVVQTGASTSSIYGGKVKSLTLWKSKENATNLTIETGTTIQGAFGGFYKNSTGITSLDSDMELNIQGGTFNAIVGGADRISATGMFSHTGNVSLTISGGMFNKQVFGGSYREGNAGLSENSGSITMNISGGTFKSWVYGGNLACNKKSATGSITGDISITVDTSVRKVEFWTNPLTYETANLVLGSNDYGTVNGNGKVTFKGDGGKLTFTGFVLGGASKSYYITDDQGKITEKEDYFSGSTTCAFDAFSGNFAGRIILFDKMDVSNGSNVNFTNSQLNLGGISTWDFDVNTALNGIKGNDFTDDTMNIDLAGWESNSWDVMTADNAARGFQGWDSLKEVNFIDGSGISHGATWNSDLNGYTCVAASCKVVVDTENHKMTVSTYTIA